MSPAQDEDRSEAATPHKLAEARKRAEVARSPDIVAGCVLLAAAALISQQGATIAVDGARWTGALLSMAGEARGGPEVGWRLWSWCAESLRAAAALCAPPATALLVVAVLAHLAHAGPVLSLHPLKPDWQRLNPARALARWRTARPWIDGLRAVIKVGAVVLAANMVLAGAVAELARGSRAAPLAQATVLGDLLARLAFALAAVMLATALVDLLYARREFARQMRMSRRELRDEVRHREGDPRIRARLRELRRELRRRSLALRRTAQADVVLTNPTHLAVALRYRHGEMDAPVVLGKGAGLLAAAMRAIAARHRIPVLHSPAVARALHARAEIDAPIPVELYRDIARLMTWVLAMRAARAGGNRR